LGSGRLSLSVAMARPETARENQGGTTPSGQWDAGIQCRHGPAGNGQEEPRGHYALWAVGCWNQVQTWLGLKRPGRTKGALCSLGSGTLESSADMVRPETARGGPRGHHALWAVGRWDPVQIWPGWKLPGRTKGALCSLGSGTRGSGADMARPETARGDQGDTMPFGQWGAGTRCGHGPAGNCQGESGGSTMPLGYKRSAGAQRRHGSAECSPRKPRGHFALWAPERRMYLSKK